MCMANALWAQLNRVVFGATIAGANRHCLQIQIPAKKFAWRSNVPCTVEDPSSANFATHCSDILIC
jgi:tRNA(adenine34) deaminase